MGEGGWERWKRVVVVSNKVLFASKREVGEEVGKGDKLKRFTVKF